MSMNEKLELVCAAMEELQLVKTMIYGLRSVGTSPALLEMFESVEPVAEGLVMDELNAVSEGEIQAVGRRLGVELGRCET